MCHLKGFREEGKSHRLGGTTLQQVPAILIEERLGTSLSCSEKVKGKEFALKVALEKVDLLGLVVLEDAVLQIK